MPRGFSVGSCVTFGGGGGEEGGMGEWGWRIERGETEELTNVESECSGEGQKGEGVKLGV